MRAGRDSDKETSPPGNEEDPKNPEDPEELIAEEEVHAKTILMFKCALLFIQGAAKALYNNQMVSSLDIL